MAALVILVFLHGGVGDRGYVAFLAVDDVMHLLSAIVWQHHIVRSLGDVPFALLPVAEVVVVLVLHPVVEVVVRFLVKKEKVREVSERLQQTEAVEEDMAVKRRQQCGCWERLPCYTSRRRRNLRGDLYRRRDLNRSGHCRRDQNRARVKPFQQRQRRPRMPPAGSRKKEHVSIRISSGILELVMMCCMYVLADLVRRAEANTL